MYMISSLLRDYVFHYHLLQYYHLIHLCLSYSKLAEKLSNDTLQNHQDPGNQLYKFK